tara:strand:- start:1765 stop:2172 length:408 start_codon:yes stop_codon:yes gene_type:complete
VVLEIYIVKEYSMADITMEEASEFVFHKTEDKTVNKLINKISSRAISSNAKHNNTIDEVNKTIGQWTVEALEESMDMSVYLQRLLELISEITVHIEDLGWESQRMSSDGRNTLKILWEYFDIPWDDGIEKGENYG